MHPCRFGGRLGPAPSAASPPPALSALRLTPQVLAQRPAKGRTLVGLLIRETKSPAPWRPHLPGAVCWRHLVATCDIAFRSWLPGLPRAPIWWSGVEGAVITCPGGSGGWVPEAAGLDHSPSDGQPLCVTLLQGTHTKKWTNTTAWGN